VCLVIVCPSCWFVRSGKRSYGGSVHVREAVERIFFRPEGVEAGGGSARTVGQGAVSPVTGERWA